MQSKIVNSEGPFNRRGMARPAKKMVVKKNLRMSYSSKMIELKKSLKFLLSKQFLNGLQIVLFIIAIIQLFILIRQNKHSTEQDSAQFMLAFNAQLRGEHGFSKLIIDIADKQPIFINCSHTEEEVDNYLVLWELVDNIFKKDLISIEELYSAFGYDIQKASKNKEIKDYIIQQRAVEKGDMLYPGFDHLVKVLGDYKPHKEKKMGVDTVNHLPVNTPCRLK